MSLAKESREEAFAFECEGSQVLGVIHHTAFPVEWGMLCIVAGGPQYRGGCGRQLVELGRELSSRGFPVMRFDHRGLGDSDGEFKGFEHLHSDIHAAVEAFKARVPSLQHIVLWGGCDAASAALINGHRYPNVASIVAANPWVSTDQTAARVRQKHYGKRLSEWSFWKKVLTLQYNPAEYLKDYLRKRKKRSSKNSPSEDLATAEAASYVDRMRDGVLAFRGPLLFLMSGRSLISREFDELLVMDDLWKEACGRPSVSRVEIEDADQTFSTRKAKNAMIQAAVEWMESVSRKEAGS